LTPGERGRRAVEVALGVAVGLAIADMLVLIIGVGAAQIGVVVALATTVASQFGLVGIGRSSPIRPRTTDVCRMTAWVTKVTSEPKGGGGSVR
jgi:hypothetical protein